MSRSGLELVHKWIDVNMNLGMSEEQMDGLTFVYGSDMYRIHKKTNQKGLDILADKGKVVVFRQPALPLNPYICRCCGSEYDNEVDTVRCCVD
jgi:hypothetical protein